MKFTILFVLFVSFIGSAWADSSCTATATEKKLYGAAKTSFMKKCEKDARAVCSGDNVSQKIYGAAKNAHIIKCVKDAVGN